MMQRLNLAQQLLDEGQVERALQFADPALYPVNTFGMNVLNTLREKNRAAADERFKMLAMRAAADPLSDANSISLLSSYVFTPFPIVCHDRVVAEYRRHGANMSGNAVRMLRATLAVHGSQRPYVRGDARLRQAYREGDRYWRQRYGEWVVENVRANLRGRARWGEAARGALFVLRHYPRGFFRHAGRKLYCVLFRVKKSPAPAAEAE